MMPFITGALAVVYLAAAYYLLILPKIGPLIEGGDLDTSILKGQQAERQAYQKKLADAETGFKGMNAEKKEKIGSAVPTDPDVPGILVALDAVAKDDGFVLTSIDTVVDEKMTTPAGSRMVRISANMSGGDYEQFKFLLSDIARSLRLFDVQSVVFTPNSGNYALVMRAYFYSPEYTSEPLPE